MNQAARTKRLRCALCLRGLLKEYNVYDLPDDGVPVLYSTVNGYFYRKGSRHSAEVLEVAGNISESSAYTFRMIVFKNAQGKLGCKVGDLIELGVEGNIYKIAEIREIYDICNVLDLEMYPYGISY